MLKIGIVQNIHHHIHFIHRTFAEYIVAESIRIELQQNQNAEFQRYLIEEILSNPQLNVTRAFQVQFDPPAHSSYCSNASILPLKTSKPA